MADLAAIKVRLYPNKEQREQLDRAFGCCRFLWNQMLNFKLRFVTEEINRILDKWQAPSIEDFLAGARDGTYEEAEGDAIDMANLVDMREDIYRLRDTWRSA